MSRMRGFSLLEVLVALVLVGVVLLTASGLYWQQQRIGRRLAAARAADSALENAYELLRSGALPLVSGVLPAPGGGQLALTATVEDSHLPELHQLEIAADYRVGDETHRRTLAALVYAP